MLKSNSNLKNFLDLSKDPPIFYTSLKREELEELLTYPLSFYLIKRCSSHLIFYLYPFNKKKATLFLKLYITRPYKRNRVKGFYLATQRLLSLDINFINPLLLWWTPPLKAYLKNLSFYGGILFPYLEKGFLNQELLSSLHRNLQLELLQNLIEFIFQLHTKRVIIKDTKLNNFYYTPQEGFKIFDLDGLKFLSHTLSPKDRIKNLVPLVKSLLPLKIKDIDRLVFEIYQKFYSQLTERDYNLLKTLLQLSLHRIKRNR